MSNANDWVEALNINPEKLSEWSAQVPEGTPLLVWCLENGHVPADAYFAWAAETYQLPILDPEFFKTAFEASMIPADRGGSPWQAWCFPVASWEEVTYVACVQPPSEVPTGRFAFVLADPTVLRATWGEPTSTSVRMTKAAVNAPPEMPAGMNLNLNPVKPFSLNIDEANILGSQAPALEETPRELPEEAPSAPLKSAPPMKTAVAAAPAAAAPAKAKPAPAESEVDSAYRHLKEYYNSSMILKLEGEGLKLVGFSPEHDLSPINGQELVRLAEPSLFRIVQKTQLPYHGYIVDSEIHRAFFKKLGLDDLPACVTAAPIKRQGALWGMIVAIGPDTAQRAKPLQAVESAAEKLGSSVGELLAA